MWSFYIHGQLRVVTSVPIQFRFTFPSGRWMDLFGFIRQQPLDRSLFRSPLFLPSVRDFCSIMAASSFLVCVGLFCPSFSRYPTPPHPLKRLCLDALIIHAPVLFTAIRCDKIPQPETPAPALVFRSASDHSSSCSWCSSPRLSTLHFPRRIPSPPRP